MGLATVHGIIKQAGGHISVYSEVGCGTTLKLYFPSAGGEAQLRTPAAPRATAPSGSETILVVEDNPSVRNLTCANLARRGYKVLQAGSGTEAMQVVAAHTGRISLLLTDVIMPAMGGRQLADQLTAREPQLKVVYMSGYTDDAVIRHGVLESSAGFLHKPFSSNALLRKVRDAIDEGKAC
jgi:CheY-like chemotaxis protein